MGSSPLAWLLRFSGKIILLVCLLLGLVVIREHLLLAKTTGPALIYQQSFSHSVKANQQLQRTPKSNSPPLCFRLIIILNQKNLDDLDSFMAQLYKINTLDCTVHLQFLLPTGSDELAAYADQLIWPAGKVYTQSTDRIGKDQLVDAWKPDGMEFALFLDNVRSKIDEGIIGEFKQVLEKYFVTCKRERILSNTGRAIIGVGLDRERKTRLIQKPAELMLFFPWAWPDILRYVEWRKDNEAPVLYTNPLMDTTSWRQ
jgi:hypothetical protein